jgi:hypothetical protein
MCSIARLIAASTFASYSGDQIRKAPALAALSLGPQPIAIYSDRGVRVSALAGIEHTDPISSIKSRWLIPRLPKFQRDHPALELRIVTASTATEQFQMDVDAVISRAASCAPAR